MRNLRKQQVDAPAQTDDSQLRDEDVVGFCLNPDGTLRQSLKLRELDPTTSKNGKENLHNLLAGSILVVDARLAGLRHGLLDDVESAPPRTADDGQEWLSEGATGFRVCAVDAGAAIPKDQTWRERYRFAAAVSEDGEVTRWLVIHKWREDAATEEDRSAGYPQLLDEHQSWTEERARRLAKSLGLDGALTEILALAARLHDEGKRAARWQRAFHAPNDGIYAKTEGPIDYRLLDGYRHELGSLLRAEKDQRIQNLSAPERDLVLHLIAAHHGFARPVIGVSGCEDAPPSVLEEKASEIALRFARLQDQWGPWGLAWLEALLRAADQQASRENDARAGAKEGA
jgi:CRISPR-associated endonuclease/helicase Cas3